MIADVSSNLLVVILIFHNYNSHTDPPIGPALLKTKCQATKSRFKNRNISLSAMIEYY